MEIAVFVCSNGSNAISQRELAVRLALRLKLCDLNTLRCLENDIGDIVLRKHRVFYRTYAYLDDISFNGNHGNMLFQSGIDRSGNQFFHLLSAAHNGYTLIYYLNDDIATMRATVKLNCHVYILLRSGSE